MIFTKNSNAFILVPLKDDNWLERQRFAGRVVAECLRFCKETIESKTPNTSLKDLEKECEDIINKRNCTPTFKGYRGFPGAICASVNEEIVHGIPSDRILKEGDIVKIDVGATHDGAIGDAAITAIYGEPKDKKHKELVESCENALYYAIDSIVPGKCRIGIVGDNISYIAKRDRFRVITEYGGHGIDDNAVLHGKPFVSNKSTYKEGIRIQPGMSFTIEPMFTIGSHKIKIDKNNWTVVCTDMAAHWEHSLFVHKDHVEILTDIDNLD